LNACLSHALGNGAATALDASLDDFTMHSRTAVGIVMFLYADLLDGLSDLRLLDLSLRRITPNELVVRSSRHFEDSTEHRDRPAIAMLVDELQPQLLSFAKNAVAFFKMSRSILSWRFSSRSRFSSASTD
jgi:hypothetical protein